MFPDKLRDAGFPADSRRRYANVAGVLVIWEVSN